MNSLKRSVWMLMSALAAAGVVHAQVPRSNDTSDENSNTGMGTKALGGPAASNGGSFNTASGYDALHLNKTGNFNTASGIEALYSNTTGNSNTASGAFALFSNTTGHYNTASGYSALYLNATADYNTASGFWALYSNTTGSDNSASGAKALYSNTTGSDNAGVGYGALYKNTTGDSNLAFGYKALFSNEKGENNIALGNSAGYSVLNSYNIEIGSEGLASDSHTIRIGAPSTQSSAYIAGISTTHLTGAAVYVNSSGQLGVLASSERYKTAIAPINTESERLRRLRPVTFRLKADPKGAVQYGLIAEEVDKVYPELVIRDGAGKIQGVRYDELAPMLLSEVQKQQQTIVAQDRKLAEVGARVSEIPELKRQMAAQAQIINTQADQAARIRRLEEQLATMQMALLKLASKDQLVAQR